VKVWKSLLTAATALVVVAVGAGVALAAPSPDKPARTRSVDGDPGARGAAALVARRPAFLHASADEAFVQGSVITSEGTRYVPYERTYAGLPVVGGDFVIVTDATGKVITNSVAMRRPIGKLSKTPKLAQADAERVAGQQLTTVEKVEGTLLVVYALGETPRLAWESTVQGTGPHGESRLTVEVDALTGAVLSTQEHVSHGTGTSAYNGPNPITFNTGRSTASSFCVPLAAPCFALVDPTIRGLECYDLTTTGSPLFKGPDDLWGDGIASTVETGCVDAMIAAQTQDRMLRQWLGRNSFTGTGLGFRIEVGINEANAFYFSGGIVKIGRNFRGRWLSSLDIVGHEFGHGVDDKTPGGISRNGTKEFIADAFGAATEHFANQPAPFDTPDFLFGEVGKFDGFSEERNMFNPAALGSPNCYSSAIPSAAVHDDAGPGNHWFYLLSQGSVGVPGNPAHPTSPTCDGSVLLNGIGVKDSIRILYNAMLMKTTASSYLRYRVWTLQAAINLFPGSCTAYNAVRNAWNAVSVPRQPDEPTCTGTGLGATWTGYGEVPGNGGTTAGPATVAFGTKLRVFTRGAFDAIYENQFDGTTWSGWIPVPGQLATPAAPAVASYNGRLHLFTMGNDFRIYDNVFDGKFWSGSFEVPGNGGTISGLGVAVAGGVLRLFHRGGDNRIYQNVFDNTTWSGWSEVPGNGGTFDAPAATELNGFIHLFVRGLGDLVYVNIFNGTIWSGWSAVPGGGVTPSAPGVSVLRNVLRLFIRRGDNRIFENVFDGASWSGYREVPGNGGTLSAPGAAVYNNTMYKFSHGALNRIYVNRLS
jgi:zinc metalloprotease ZmpA